MKICWFCVTVVCLVLNVVFQPGVNKVSTRWHAATCNIPHVFTSTEDLRKEEIVSPRGKERFEAHMSMNKDSTTKMILWKVVNVIHT